MRSLPVPAVSRAGTAFPAAAVTPLAVAASALMLAGASQAGTLPSWFQTAPSTDTSAPVQPPLAGLIAAPGEAFEIVPLKYADVSEVVSLLTGARDIKPDDSFAPQEPNFGSSGLQFSYGGASGLPTAPLSSPSGGGSGGTEPLGRVVDATIGIDRRLDAIVLRGPQATIDAIKAQIKALDVPVESVIFETEFVELTESGARNLGFDLNNGNDQIATGAYVYAKGFPGLSDTPGKGGSTLSVQAALYAQIAKGDGRIVSKPRIAAQSGGSAKIVTGDALPILTSIALSGVNAVQQQVQYVNVGVTLQIAPRVNQDGFVTSQIFAVVSSVTGYSQGYPTISQREASTSATVRDGEPFVIGGLTQDSSIANKTKLPGLGDVPLLGALTSVEHTNNTKRDLYIVVTPHIVKVPAR